jgi:hypothetical protein
LDLYNEAPFPQYNLLNATGQKLTFSPLQPGIFHEQHANLDFCCSSDFLAETFKELFSKVYQTPLVSLDLYNEAPFPQYNLLNATRPKLTFSPFQPEIFHEQHADQDFCCSSDFPAVTFKELFSKVYTMQPLFLDQHDDAPFSQHKFLTAIGQIFTFSPAQPEISYEQRANLYPALTDHSSAEPCQDLFFHAHKTLPVLREAESDGWNVLQNFFAENDHFLEICPFCMTTFPFTYIHFMSPGSQGLTVDWAVSPKSRSRSFL